MYASNFFFVVEGSGRPEEEVEGVQERERRPWHWDTSECPEGREDREGDWEDRSDWVIGEKEGRKTRRLASFLL